MTTTSTNPLIQTVCKFVDNIVLGGKLDQIGQYVTPDVSVNSLVGISGSGVEVSRQAFTLWTKAFNFIDSELISSAVNDSKVINHWKVRAIHKSDLLGVPATNKELTFTGVTIYEVKDEKISAIWSYSDFTKSIESFHQ
ncbi:MAG: hypothetical protein GWP59_05125 [Chlamydiales bacterium]|nr:hypothetical protein [Chlamydiales bacterium]